MFACDSIFMHRSGDDGLQSPSVGSPGLEKGQYKFHFNIGSIDSFERKMEEAQEDLGWGTDSFVPITYTNELSWQQVHLALLWSTLSPIRGLGRQLWTCQQCLPCLRAHQPLPRTHCCLFSGTRSYVPCVHSCRAVSIVSICMSLIACCMQELLRLAPTILLIAGYVWFTRRQMGGLGGQGPGGRGLFNVGKAQVRPSTSLSWLS